MICLDCDERLYHDLDSIDKISIENADDDLLLKDNRIEIGVVRNEGNERERRKRKRKKFGTGGEPL